MMKTIYRLGLIFVIIIALGSPFVHEGLHAMACELQGGTARASLTMTWCKAEFNSAELERYYSAPYIPFAFIYGLSLPIVFKLGGKLSNERK